ncbi:L,D-transpeptidase family protein [Psychromonas aquimarina]|uniref:L,D-transpeptidase family protein n=1 Tax=Psychromonas aquimarina TaxID=444919 RepID=UPI0004051F2F|nr:murein L,D-transpeptidase family protein [Psychromonas aquimarina]
MNALKKVIKLLLLISFNAAAVDIPTSPRADRAIASVESSLKKELSAKGLEYGAPVFIRIFKDPGVLELWLESSNGKFVNFKNYDICTFSGDLGPKLKEGDNQSPEGFYFVNSARLNPWSRFHLSFNLGYPNKYDRHHGRTGSALMVHGNCVSIGCYAMTDSYINEIYALGAAALKSGQPFFRVHSFPFKLDRESLIKYQSSQWYLFWLNLKDGYDYFNLHKRPPNVEVLNGKYIFGA